MQDSEILAQYLAREEQAISKTAQAYGKLCYHIAYNILQSREDAEECVNDTYMALWNAIPPAQPQNLMAFACQITRNLSLGRLAHRTRRKRDAGMLLAFEELAEVLPDDRITDGVTDSELGDLINRFLRDEKEDSRAVFIRKYYFFDSIRTIARRYGFTESKVKNMLHHTRTRLKEFLKEEGIYL